MSKNFVLSYICFWTAKCIEFCICSLDPWTDFSKHQCHGGLQGLTNMMQLSMIWLAWPQRPHSGWKFNSSLGPLLFLPYDCIKYDKKNMTVKWYYLQSCLLIHSCIRLNRGIKKITCLSIIGKVAQIIGTRNQLLH